MKNKIKKWHIALMSFLTLFVTIFASLFSLRADTVDEETGEELTDNWEFNMVFYDSSVDTGVTPLTRIDWDASDGGFAQGTPRDITVQINYRNDNPVQTYQPGELEIQIPNLVYSDSSKTGTIYDAQLIPVITLGANDGTHTGYDWNFTTATSPSTKHEFFTFTNKNVIEEKVHYEGTIQITYTITPQKENSGSDKPKVERYKNECTHNYNKILKATLSYNKTLEDLTTEKVEINSNELDFNYTRTYYHPWTKREFGVSKLAASLKSLDIPYTLCDNANDYYWVNYKFKVLNYGLNDKNDTYAYPHIPWNEYMFEDVFSENCIVSDESGNLLTSENGKYQITTKSLSYHSSQYYYYEGIIVGYPKSEYNETNNNLKITNTVKLYASYVDGTDFTYQAEDDININLANFNFSYPGKLYNITKSFTTSSTYEEITGKDPKLIGKNYGNTTLNPTFYYTGKPMDIKFGDDLLYITSVDGNYRKLLESEYYFSNISFPGKSNFKVKNTYDVELWIRKGTNKEYVLYETFPSVFSTNSMDLKTFNFTKEDHVTGYYFVIKNVTESITESIWQNSYIKFFGNSENIAETGRIYNLCFLQVFIDGVIQNTPTFDSYANLLTQEEIATYDLDMYGMYMQRNSSYYPYYNYEIEDPYYLMSSEKTMTTPTQDSENEQFLGSSTLKLRINTNDNYNCPWTVHELITYATDELFIQGFEMYDVLPEGMELTSTTEDIINSLKNISENGSYIKIYNKQGELIPNNSFTQMIKENMTIQIIKNWNNSNRTYIYIKVDFTKNPLAIKTTSTSSSVRYADLVTLTYNWKITYDSYLEHGKTWKNVMLWNYLTRNFSNSGSYSLDKDNNGNIVDDSERFLFDLEHTPANWILKTDSFSSSSYYNTQVYGVSKAAIVITSVVSTHQDVTTFVQTDLSDYSTGIVDSSCDSEYKYKLRVRTGAADITNLIIYTSIEEAQPKRTRWYGEFLGVDTTYAENKGYTVKIWYSPNKTVGTLAEDTSWQIYDEATVDKSKVKSLAFQYLVETDDITGTSTDTIDPAILPANSLTYVIIKMKSPADESLTTLARMDCWTQWNALDDYDRPVDFITGINSNVVKVALPNSDKTDDMPSISLKFIKEIQGETSDFENLKLNKTDEHIFMIRLTSLIANDDGSYNQVTGLLSSTQGLVITQIPIGTYLLEELGDNYFDFVEFTNNNDPEITIEDVTFEKTDQGYIITVSEDLSQIVEFNIKVTNKIEDERFYEEKHNKENLFLINKINNNMMDPDDPQGH